MNLTIQGQKMDLGDALRTHVTDKLEDINQKYFNRAIDANISFSPEGSAFTKTHISLRIGKNIMVMADATEKDPYASFDSAAEKVAKQLRRYKKRLRDHHERLDETEKFMAMAKDYTLSPEEEKDDTTSDTAAPVIIAEMTTPIQTMSVSEAVMRMDLAGHPAMLFHNATHKGLNMVYRRADGNVGWVDPSENAEQDVTLSSAKTA